jgi:adenosylcobinamide-GDP ribazoletransferase
VSGAPFWLALQFLTRLPVPRGVDLSPEAFGYSVVCYPLVGLLLGTILVGLALLLSGVGPALQAALLLSAWVWLTGGLHLDGLGDSADAWVGSHGDRERSLAILKDPYSGPIAVAAIVLVLLLKFAAATESMAADSYAPLWLAPAFARSLVPAFLLTTPYVRDRGLASPLLENLPRRAAFTAVVFTALGSLIGLGPLPLLLGMGIAWLLRATMMRRLGGCTGDTLGASIEITETTVLVASALT